MSMQKPPLSPYGEFIGVSIDDFAEGKSTCSVVLKDHHLNNGGRVHGGVLTSLADTAAGAAVRSVRPEGKFSATTDLSISFIRPPTGDNLLAKAEVIHAGRQLFRVEIAIFSEKKLVAKTNATFMIVEPLNKS
jgi:uncharacterized protein (TIGR00369 family)